MADVQTQWVKEDGKWCQKAVKIDARPALPSRPSQQTSKPALPPRRTNIKPSNEPAIIQPFVKSTPTIRRPSDEESTSPHSRRTSTIALSRRTSDASINSAATAETSLSTLSNNASTTSKPDRFTIRAPDYDPAALPALPPRRTKEEKDAEGRPARYPVKSTKSSTIVPQTESTRPSPPERSHTRAPPPLPKRGNLPEETPQTAEEVAPKPVVRNMPDRPALPIRQQPSEAPRLPSRNTATSQPLPMPQRTIIPPPAKRSALSMGFGNSNNAASPSVGTRPAQPGPRPVPVSQMDSTPPPVPLSSRPDLAALQASKPKSNDAISGRAAPVAAANSTDCCLECRDFSAADNHAARFPRESLPSQDLGWLAQQLTGQFTSDTDKARSIFTWLHHNIAYDTVAFFGNNVKPSTPNSTLATGLAVCEGYAGLFTALALKAGLESKVVGGHGKGFGYSPHVPGTPLPEYDAGHAWSAVKIDGGEWKLVDPCWGAGSVCDRRAEAYQKRFAPEHFTKSNDMFGLSHYPGDPSEQYRNDGRIMSWEEYATCNKEGTQGMVYSGYVAEEGISQYSMKPVANPIVVAEQGPTIRFSFQTVCPHYDSVKRAKGGYFLYVLHLDGIQDPKRNDIPFQKGEGVWWCDVATKDLGHAGQNAMIYVVKEFCKKDGRGLTAEQYMLKRRGGCYSWQFGGVAQFTIG